MAKVIKASVTLETLRNGCRQLAISYKPNHSAKALEDKIVRELQKDKTFGSYACGACQRDIIDVIPMCPFCSAKFRIAEVLSGNESSEESDIFDQDLESGTEEESKEQEESTEDLTVPEEVETKAKEKGKLKRKKKKPKPETESKTSRGIRRKQKEEEREAKREVIRQELPYSLEDLKGMKRVALIMVAGVLEVDNPVSLGSDANIIRAIWKKQIAKFKGKGKRKKA